MSGENVVWPPFGQARQQQPPTEVHIPQHTETEAGLLGALLLHPDAYSVVSSILAVEHFFDARHGHVYKAVRMVAEAGQTVRYNLVAAALGETWLEGEVEPGWNGRQFLAHLAAEATSIIGVADSARLIRDYWALREINRIASLPMTGQGYIAPVVLGNTLDQIDGVRAALFDREKKSATVGQAAMQLLDDIERSHNGEAADYPVTGLTKIDATIGGGLRPSTMVSLFGRTSIGKSVVGVEITDRAAEQRFGVIYHSLEMPAKAVTARIISSRLERGQGVRIPFIDMLRHKGLTPAQAKLVHGAARELQDLPLRIEDGPGKTIGEIAALSDRRANELARKNVKLGLVVIDHGHLVKFGRKYNREDEGLREVTQGALGIAKRLDCCVLLLGQLNRKTEDESRGDRRPQLADIRGGGSFEEDSDTILFLYRHAYYVQRSPEYRAGDAGAIAEFRACEHHLELIVDKNRQGPANVVHKLWIDPALNAVRNLDDRG